MASTELEGTVSGFSTFGLDVELEQALLDLGYTTPSSVQVQAIPLILDGRDVLARARTGSGKTVAYLAPLIQRVLLHKAVALESGTEPARGSIKGLVLVPSRELCRQVYDVVSQLTVHCPQRISFYQVGSDDTLKSTRLLGALPDVLLPGDMENTSKHHALIEFDDTSGRFVLANMSKYGTVVDDQKLEDKDAAPLVDGSRFVIGSRLFAFRYLFRENPPDVDEDEE